MITHKVEEVFTSETQNIWCVDHFMYMYCEVKKYISIRAFLKPISKSFTSNFRTENIVRFKKFELNENEINLKMFQRVFESL